MPARIADLGSNRLIQATIANTQQRSMDRQLKISTMQKSQDYAGIADNSSRLVTLEASRIRINKFMSEHTFIQLRMDTMLNSVDALKNTINDVRKLLREALDDGTIPKGINKDEFATVKMGEIEDFLNVRVNGRYLFAGSKTDTKPVQPGIAVVSHSGGISSLTADMCGQAGLDLPPLTDRARDGINGVLKGFGWAANPSDVTGFANSDSFPEIMEYMINTLSVLALET